MCQDIDSVTIATYRQQLRQLNLTRVQCRKDSEMVTAAITAVMQNKKDFEPSDPWNVTHLLRPEGCCLKVNWLPDTRLSSSTGKKSDSYIVIVVAFDLPWPAHSSGLLVCCQHLLQYERSQLLLLRCSNLKSYADIESLTLIDSL